MERRVKRTCGTSKGARRRPYNQALKNVISLRISDEELVQLTRIREETAKSFSEIMRDAFNGMQGQSGAH